MSRVLWIAAAVFMLGATPTLAQVDTSFDTISVIQSTSIIYEGQTVDYFILDVGDSRLAFIQDPDYVRLLGFEENGDTTLLSEPTVWMKINNPTVGNQWSGMVPTDNLVFTNEEITSSKLITVPAGTFQAYEIGVSDLNGTYLGEKWWVDGVGLLGWHLQICNKTDDLELVSYSVAPGSDFWPHQVGDSWVFRDRTTYTFSQAPQATIAVDGNPNDWLSYTPVLQDPALDDTSAETGTDLGDIYVAADATKLYVLMKFWDGSPNTTFGATHSVPYAILLSNDGLGNRTGYIIRYTPTPTPQWYATGLNMNATGSQVAAGTALEFSVPLANLGGPSSELPEFAVAVDSGYYETSCDTDVRLPGYCPIVMTGDMQGDFALSASDIVYMVNFVLKGGPAPSPCPATGDVNCNGGVSTSDIIFLVNRVFKAGPVPCNVCSIIPGMWSCP